VDSSSDARRAVAEKLLLEFLSARPHVCWTRRAIFYLPSDLQEPSSRWLTITPIAKLHEHTKQRLPISEEALPAVDDALTFPPGLHERPSRRNGLVSFLFNRPHLALNPLDLLAPLELSV